MRRVGTASDAKGYRMSKTQKMKSVSRVWRTADGLARFECRMCVPRPWLFTHSALKESFLSISAPWEQDGCAYFCHQHHLLLHFLLCSFPDTSPICRTLTSTFSFNTIPPRRSFPWPPQHPMFSSKQQLSPVWLSFCLPSNLTLRQPPPPSVLWYTGLPLIPWGKRWNTLPLFSSTLHRLFFRLELSCPVLPDRMIKEGLWNEVRFEPSKGTSHMVICGKSVLSRKMARKP